jgi:lysozyme
MSDDDQNVQKVDNSKLRMSAAAKARMRAREDPKYHYYDDGGRPGRGNCTWGIGTLAHRGACTDEELKREVGPAEVEAAFAERVADAERTVRRKVPNQALSQIQFDALVSFVYNAGWKGSENVLSLVDDGDFKEAAAAISRTIYMTVKTRRGSKKVVARGLIGRRAEESAPFRTPER